MRAQRLPQVRLGIGDDAAVLQGGPDAVVTTDSLLEGVHFTSDQLYGPEATPRRIGQKLVNVNLSDLAAMAAEPNCIFLSLCLPHDPPGIATDALAAEIYEGVCEAAEKANVAIAGGDTNCWDGPLTLHLTAVGHPVDGIVWTRSGAQPDDLIVVTGPLGGSLAGKQFDFTPRFDWVRKVRSRIDIHAAMDISDGLSVDLLRLCDASGCGGILELDRIPVADAANEMAKSSGKQPIEHALGDGEDFELLIAIAPESYPDLVQLVGESEAIVIGDVTSRTGLWSRDGARLSQLSTSGFIHGR